MTTPNILKEDAAKATLLSFKGLSPDEQREHKQEIVAAFRVLWNSHPPVDIFERHTAGIVLYPEMLYIIAGRQLWLSVPPSNE